MPTLERTLVRASLAGADVRTEPREPRGDAPDQPHDGGARAWPVDRLAGVWISLIGRLGAERDVALAAVAQHGGGTASTVTPSRTATNDDVARFRAVVETYLEVLADVRPAIHAAARELGRLDLVRRTVDEHLAVAGEIREAYDTIAETLADAVDGVQGRDEPTSRRRPPRAMAPSRQRNREELRA
jgi:hypothetical protein